MSVWVQNAGDGSSLATIDLPETPAVVPSTQASEDYERAMRTYQQIRGLDRRHVGTLVGAALLEGEAGRYDAAEFLLKRSIAVAPTCVAYNSLGHFQCRRRQYDDAIANYRASLELDPTNLTTWPNLLFALDLHPYATPALRLAERRRFDAVACKPLTDAAPPHANDPDPEKRLRVGYVSADFKQHSAAHGFGPAVQGHDSERFEVHLYDVDQSPENAEDQVASWYREHDRFIRHDVRGFDDAALASTIRTDGIDILVDLSGYSAGGRPMTFARKPAPVQISGFGYATGLGISAMDYLIGDAVVIPERHEQFYAEKILHLPCFMGFDLPGTWPEVGPPPRERNGYTTFGYLGRALKISPQCLAAWAEILRRVEGSRLILKSGEYDDSEIVRQITSALVALGVDADRLEFRPGTNRHDHLATYGDIDISLDPFPHAGGVTTIESFLMGVPTVTLLGDYICGRTGASYLTSFGFEAAIARTPHEYIRHAVVNAEDTWTLEDRQSLRLCALRSPLMDREGYARAVDDAYRAAWTRWCLERTA
jgi:protein O-GlcNAc transferase